jgi:hypothetical protein
MAIIKLHNYEFITHSSLSVQLGYKRRTFLTVLVHARLDALAQSTSSTLIAVGLIHNTAALCLSFAHVLPLPSDRPLEEAGAAATVRNNASSYTSRNNNKK